MSPVPTRSRGSFLSRREQREEQVGERRRALVGRWLPVAAGVLVLGAAAGVGITQLGGADGGTATEGGAAGEAAAAPAPRALVATGTDYTTTDEAAFQAQVEQLVAVASSGTAADAVAPEAVSDSAAGGAGDAAPEEAASAAAQDTAAALEGDTAAPGAAEAADPRAGVAGSSLVAAEALRRCVDEVAGEGSPNAVAVDLATVDGLESTVVVVPDAAGDGYLVYVVGPDCEAGTLREFYRLTT